jgi:hypothetical protein
MNKEEILKVHTLYDNNKSQWQYYLDSYMGGAQYKTGKYLTQYLAETDDEYNARIKSTPCDNHCKNIVQIYNSFIWRTPPQRELVDAPEVESFIRDAGLDGQSLNQVLRDATVWSSVFGHCWVMIDKPLVEVETRAEEMDLEIRPYLTVITPNNILDWRFERTVNGRYMLTYLKVMEDAETVRIWTRDEILVYKVDGKEAKLESTIANNLKEIPIVPLYSSRGLQRGVGISDIADVADYQKAIYSELSEIEQLIRISNHPTLVKTASADASAGAGGVIDIDDDSDGGLKPYLLQPNAASLSGVMQSISEKVEAINRITHMGSVRATEKQAKSGVALQTEFQLLNTKLSEKASALENLEEQIWRLFYKMQGYNDKAIIKYPDSFDIRDNSADLLHLQQVKASGINSESLSKIIDKQIAQMVVEEQEQRQVFEEIDAGVSFEAE